MHTLYSFLKSRMGLMPLLLAAFVAGCGGGVDPILGTPSAGMVPSVSATLPAAATPSVTSVATNTRVTATFSEPMTSASLTGAFTLACPAGTPVSAAVSYDAATRTATLTPAAVLPARTLCVATVSTAAQDATGVALAANFVWSFTTGSPPETTRPTVLLTVPALGAVNVANNTKVTAAFSEDMNPATISGTSFSVTNTTLGAAVAGTVTYSAAARTATFTPTAGTLANNSLFTATVTSAATDVTGNGLAGNTAVLPNAGNHVWTFTTSAAGDSTAPTVTTISPLDASTDCLTKSVGATFSEAMDAATITASSFVVTDNGVAVAGNVSYDAATRVATFVPTNAAGFAASKSFVVTVKSGATGVKDLAGNPLAADRTWGFVTGTQACTAGVNLRSAASFGSFGGAAGVTNQGINTVVNGNMGTTAACTLITGFHDGANVYTETPLNIGAVNGSVFCAPPAPGTASSMAVATQALADAQTAYNELAAKPAGSDPGAGQLGGLTLLPAVYTAAGGTFAITTGDLVLDAQGDANAVWVFQSAAALTVGLPATPRRVTLINGAQARNVFWQVGSAARIEAGSTMVGTIIAPAGVTVSTAGQTIQTTLIGRALGLTASVTLVNTTIVAP
ncbi:ice-binding family protein [Roseateles sp. P5_E7]